MSHDSDYRGPWELPRELPHSQGMGGRDGAGSPARRLQPALTLRPSVSHLGAGLQLRPDHAAALRGAETLVPPKPLFP